jgi:hypothetical protein
MNEPRGFNPVGDPAPNLPRHDDGLPGHVPGTPFANIGGGADDTWAPSAGYRDPNFPSWFGEWFGRVILFVAMFITLPVQVALYPVAGMCGIALSLPFYILFPENWAYTACFIGVVATMRIETGFEKKFPGYRTMRHLLRLGLIFGFMTYFVVHDKGDSLGMAVLVSGLFTSFMHFFLRWGVTHGLWDGLQIMGWLRKE